MQNTIIKHSQKKGTLDYNERLRKILNNKKISDVYTHSFGDISIEECKEVAIIDNITNNTDIFTFL